MDHTNKKRKITEIPSGNNYVPGIVISGKYLTGYGFNYDTPVHITVEEGIIMIEKIKT